MATQRRRQPVPLARPAVAREMLRRNRAKQTKQSTGCAALLARIPVAAEDAAETARTVTFRRAKAAVPASADCAAKSRARAAAALAV